MVLLVAISTTLGVLTVSSLREAAFQRVVQKVLSKEVAALVEQVELADWQIAGDDGETLHLEIHVRAARSLLYQEIVDLQARVALRLQQPVALALTLIPITRLDPSVPPTFTSMPDT